MEKVVAYGLYCNEKEVKKFEKQVKQEVEKHKDWKLTHIYIDYTKKIKQYGCSSFIKMLDNVLKDNVNIIVIKNIFQLLGTMNGIEVIVKYLKVAKLEILFLDEKMSIFDPNIELQINIASSIIQWEK